MDKIIEYYDNGRIKVYGYCSNGIKERQWVWFYDNGEIERLSYYKKGQLHGSEMVFNTKGEAMSATVYSQGFPMPTSRVEEALLYASKKHYGVYRKGTRIPYIVHPAEVQSIVFLVAPENERALVAAALHDTVEDSDETVEHLRTIFGDVADIVAEESEDKSKTWQERKQATIDFLRSDVASNEARLVALGDKLSNSRAMKDDLEKEGILMWNKFNEKDPIKQKQYYQGVLDALNCFDHTEEWQELRSIIHLL